MMIGIPAPTPSREPPANRWLWPLRRLSELAQRFESAYLRTFAVRQAIKSLLDFAAGLVAVAVALALEGGAPYGPLGMVALGTGAGLLLVACHTLAGSYRRIWRYAGLQDAMVVGASSGLLFTVLVLARSLEFLTLSGSTILLIALLTFFACTAVRALRRWQIADTERPVRASPTPSGHTVRQRLLIAGAGERGVSIGREITRTAPRGVELVGFLDDDPSKIGAALNGVPVFGPLADALLIAKRHQVGEVIVAMPSADPDVVRVLERQLEDAEIRVRSVRGVERFILGRNGHPSGNGNGGGESRRRVLVTGGAGFIGSHLVEELRRRGHEVLVLDVVEPRHMVDGVDYFRGDVCDTGLVRALAAKVDDVFHLAAVVGFQRVKDDPVGTVLSGTRGTDEVLRSVAATGGRALIVSSSMVVGRAVDDGKPVPEDVDAVLGPTMVWAWTYAYAKATAECLAAAYLRQRGVWATVVRPFNVVGPRQRHDAGFVVPRFVRQALAGEPLTVHAPGTQTRTFAHVADVARGMADLIACDAANGEIVNLGGVETVSMLQLADLVRDVTGSRSPVEIVERPYGDGFENVVNRKPDLTKARRLIEYEPRRTLREIVTDVVAAEMAHRDSRHSSFARAGARTRAAV